MESNRCKQTNVTSIISMDTTRKEHVITNAAHERTDIEVTEEMRKHDDAFFDE